MEGKVGGVGENNMKMICKREEYGKEGR